MNYPKLKVASVHAAPVYFDVTATIDKMYSIVKEVAAHGAQFVVFPESFIPGFPFWAAVLAPINSHEYFAKMVASSISIDGPEINSIRNMAREFQIVMSVGFSESSPYSVGCIWNTNILIGSDGSILNHHRKIVPTFYEKLVWASGDGRGLTVVDTGIGRIGGLICGENTNPLARYALMAQGEQIHFSSYPPLWPTRPPGKGNDYNLETAIRIRAGAHSFEAKVFNIVAAGALDKGLLKLAEEMGPEAVEVVENTAAGVSMIVSPTGEIIGDVMSGDEGIVYADIDVEDCVEPKRFHDVVGYYNRYDIFGFTLNRSSQEPIKITDNDELVSDAFEQETSE